MLVEVLLAAGLALLVRHLYWVCRAMWLTRDIPGPRAYPLIGNYLNMAGTQDELYDRVLAIAREFPGTVKCWLGPQLAVALLVAEDIQAALTSPDAATKPGSMYAVMDPLLGHGLVSLSGGETYQRHRKAIQPCFHLDQLQAFMDTFNRNSKLMMLEVGSSPEGGTVDMTILSSRCANRSSCDNLLMVDPAVVDPKGDGNITMAHEGAAASVYCLLRPWYLIPGVFRIMSPDMHAKYWQGADYMKDYVARVMHLKEDQLKNMVVGEAPRKCDWLLEQMTHAGGSGLSRKELEDEIRTIFFTSVMTSTDFLSFFFMVMSVRPDVQRRVQEEIREVFGEDKERDVTMADLPRLQYMECAMKEVLRMFPMVPFFGRRAIRDIPLPSGGTIPEGALLVLFPVRTHEDERWFPEPSEFRPERFLPENCEGRPQHAFVPFSSGKRGCMGQRYAIMFGKTVIATLLREFDILPAPGGPTTVQDIPRTGNLSLCVLGNAKVVMRRRCAAAS